MAPVPLDVKLEIVLDNNNNTDNNKTLRYFPGDAVHGKIFFTANQSHTLCNFRLAWTSRIQVQPIQSNKDKRTYFNECWKLGPTLTKSATKAQKGTSSVPCYTTQLVLAATSSQQPKVELQKNKTIALAFTVHVPNDRPLPSCTESVGVSPNKIIYLLEAFVDKQEHDSQKFFAQRVVPVFESIYTRTPDMLIPQRAEQVFMVSLFSEELEFTSAMRVTLPCRGCLPGVAIPVSISIWNNMEFTRKQGISISLFRINQVLANGRAYTSQGEKVHRVVTDLNITASDTNNNQKVQTVRVALPIPRGTMSTITLEQSQLLAISYFIRVQVFAQEGIYTTADGKRSQFMMVDLPFIIGTLAKPIASSNSTTTTPISSPKSASSNAILYSSAPTSPQPTRASPRLSSPPISSPPIANASLPTISPQSTLSTVTSNEKRSLIGGMFRKSSTGSQTSLGEERRNSKKKSVFSTLRLYNNKKKDEDVKQVSPAVVMTLKSPQTNTPTSSNGGVFDIFSGDDIDDVEPEEKPVVFSKMNKEESRVFKMFPDDDDDDESDGDQVVQSVASTSKYISRKEAVFKMFPDQEEDSDNDDGDEIPVNGEQQQLLDAIADTMASFALDRPKQQPTVFKMFNDDDSDSEEEIEEAEIEVSQVAENDTRVKPHNDEPRYQKPNEIIIEYKPDAKDTTDLPIKLTDSDSDDDEINDLLSLLEKKKNK